MMDTMSTILDTAATPRAEGSKPDQLRSRQLVQTVGVQLDGVPVGVGEVICGHGVLLCGRPSNGTPSNRGYSGSLR